MESMEIFLENSYTLARKEIMSMKVQNIVNIDEFFDAVNRCKEKVELLTCNGVKINLQSKLIQYVSNANVSFCEEVKDMELITYNSSDTQIMMQYMK